MGIQPTYVLPVKDHLNVLTCTLCNNLVSLDGYVTTPCSHCFCRDCFDAWIARVHSESKLCSCPTCNASISSGQFDGVSNLQVSALHDAQPLLHRMLSKVKVLCPCRHNSRNCYWTGDYGTLKQHFDAEHKAQTADEGPPKFSVGCGSTSEHQKPTHGRVSELETHSEHVRKFLGSSNELGLQGEANQKRKVASQDPIVRRRRSLSAPAIANVLGANSTGATNSIQRKNRSDGRLRHKNERHSRHTREETPGERVPKPFSAGHILSNETITTRTRVFDATTRLEPDEKQEDNQQKQGSPQLNREFPPSRPMERVILASGKRKHSHAGSTLRRRFLSLSTMEKSPPSGLVTVAYDKNYLNDEVSQLVTHQRSTPSGELLLVNQGLESRTENHVSRSMTTANETVHPKSMTTSNFTRNHPISRKQPNDFVYQVAVTNFDDKYGNHQTQRSSLSLSKRQVARTKHHSHSTSPVRSPLYRLQSHGSSLASVCSIGSSIEPMLSRLEQDANAAYKEGRYKAALDLYTKAIDAFCSHDSPSDANLALIAARLYGNRAAACLKQKMMNECIEDCDRAISINKQLFRAFSRKASALKAMGCFRDACVTLSDGLQNNPNNTELKEELAFCQKLVNVFTRIELMIDAKKYEDANRLLLKVPSSSRLTLLLQCKVDLGLGNATKVLKALVSKSTTEDLMDVDISTLLAEAYFQNGDLCQAIHHLRNALVSPSDDPPHGNANLRIYQDVQSWVLSGQSAVRDKNIDVAVSAFSNAIRLCADRLPPQSNMLRELYLLRSGAYLSAQEIPKCLEDTMYVISMDNTCVKAWVTRVKAFQAMRRNDLIVQELRDVISRFQSSFLNQAYAHACCIASREDVNECELVQKKGFPVDFDSKYPLQVQQDKCHPEVLYHKEITNKLCKGEAKRTMKLLKHELSLYCDGKQEQQNQQNTMDFVKSTSASTEEELQGLKLKIRAATSA